MRGKVVLERGRGALCADLGGDHTDTVFLAGSGRSGTTWLAETISREGGYRLIFEPFHRERVRICKGFDRKQYLRVDDAREEFLAPARAVLSGKVGNLWTERSRDRFVFRRRLVKEIRANLMLGWMRARFPGMPIVLLLRHPCAIAASRLALGWRDNLDETMRQEELVEDFLRPFEAGIRNARTPFERHLFLWCIDNYVPLMQFGPGDVHLTFYENLRVRPERELQRLFDFLGREPGALRETSRPSALSRGAVPPLDGWRRSLDVRQVGRATEILGLFGLDEVYGEDPMPDPEGARRLLEIPARSAAGSGL